MTRVGPVDGPHLDSLKNLEMRGSLGWMKRQPKSFWMVCFYLMIEYVRPHLIWPAIDVIPWAQTALLATTALMLLEGKGVRLKTIVGWTLMLFTLIWAGSVVTAYETEVAYGSIADFLLWVLVIVLIVNIVTDESKFFAFMLLFLLCSFKMSQHGFRTFVARGGGYASWGATGSPGWFQNSGEFGIQMCVFIPLIVAFIWALQHRWPRWKKWVLWAFPFTALVSIVATNSRGAMVGIGAVGLWYLVFHNKRRRLQSLIAVAVVGVGLLFLLPNESRTRMEEAGDDFTSRQRILRWEQGMEMMKQRPVFGVGYKNWLPYFEDNNFERGEWGGSILSHNIFVEVGAEMGFAGLIGFLLMIAAKFHLNRSTRSMAKATPGDNRFIWAMAVGLDGALVGYLASGFFITVFYYPYFWINLAMTIALHQSMRGKARAARAITSYRVRRGPPGESGKHQKRGLHPAYGS